jgi:hypothetical protein
MKEKTFNLKQLGRKFCLTTSLFLIASPFQTAFSQTSDLKISSSSKTLNDGFVWAKKTALSYVRTGQNSGYIASYEAALPGRNAFCIRDIEHMALGAHFLGLDNENLTMMKAFAGTATAASDYVPAWHIDFYGKIWERGHQVPTVFDAIWASYKQYLWTGNREWIDSPALFNFYKNSVTNYISRHDGNIAGNGIADAPGVDGWSNTCTYNEGSVDKFKEAGDGIGMQYQGFKSYAEILRARGDIAGSDSYMAKANDILNMFRSNFWAGSTYYRGRRSLSSYSAGYGRENSFLMPATELTEPGVRTTNYLQFIYDNCADDNGEAKSYLPEAFYPYGEREKGWFWLKSNYNSRWEYPEISYTCIGNTIRWLMGVSADAPANFVLTLPQLPSEITWIEADNVLIGSKKVKVRHDNNTKTTLTNRSGATINWEARFYGNFPNLFVAGKSVAATVWNLNGKTVSSVYPSVAAGSTLIVSTTASGSTPGTPIISYTQVNDGTWQNTATVTVTSGSKVTFGPQPIEGGSWSWTGGGTSGTNREQTIFPTTTVNATATYTNASGVKTKQVFKVNVTGARLDASKTVNVYPNPSNGTFYIDLKGSEKASMLIYDIKGQLISKETIKSGKTDISTNESLKSGTYFVKVIDSNDAEVFTKTLVIE